MTTWAYVKAVNCREVVNCTACTYVVCIQCQWTCGNESVVELIRKRSQRPDTQARVSQQLGSHVRRSQHLDSHARKSHRTYLYALQQHTSKVEVWPQSMAKRDSLGSQGDLSTGSHRIIPACEKTSVGSVDHCLTEHHALLWTCGSLVVEPTMVP